MSVVNTLNTVAHVADSIFRFATHNWTKKTLIQLAVVSVVFVGAAVVIKSIDKEK